MIEILYYVFCEVGYGVVWFLVVSKVVDGERLWYSVRWNLERMVFKLVRIFGDEVEFICCYFFEFFDLKVLLMGDNLICGFDSFYLLFYYY